MFKPGDRVRLSEHGKRTGMQGRAKSDRGLVVATTPLSQYYIRVRRDGQKTVLMYHVMHWRLEE